MKLAEIFKIKNGSKEARTPDLSRVSFTVRIKHRKGAGSRPHLKHFTHFFTQLDDL